MSWQSCQSPEFNLILHRSRLKPALPYPNPILHPTLALQCSTIVSPWQTAAEFEKQVVGLRQRYPNWGARKLKVLSGREGVQLTRSTECGRRSARRHRHDPPFMECNAPDWPPHKNLPQAAEDGSVTAQFVVGCHISRAIALERMAFLRITGSGWQKHL